MTFSRDLQTVYQLEIEFRTKPGAMSISGRSFAVCKVRIR